MTLGEQVTRNARALRTKRKITQDVLAREAGLSISYISMIERGERTPPLDTLEKLAKGLRVSPLDLLRPRGR